MAPASYLCIVVVIAVTFSENGGRVQGDTNVSYGYPYAPRGPLDGWSVLQPAFMPFDEEANKSALDALGFEWDYFMVHHKHFDGVIGFVLADPSGEAPLIMPSGGNIAVLGKVGGRIFSNFEHFGTKHTYASNTEAFMECPKGTGEHSSSHGTLAVNSTSPPTIRLSGEMQDVVYDFLVSQDWVERNGLGRSKRNGDVVSEGPFAPMTMSDVGEAASENWTVNMFWPRTKVIGSITDKTTGETFQIDGHGYRENSFGRWLFATGGWDFAIVSDADTGVQWNWQSYYTEAPRIHDSLEGSTLDLSFIDPTTNKVRAVQFSHGELGWEHPHWEFRNDSRQCMPSDAVVTAANDELVVTVTIDIGDNQVPMLSDATPVTKAYVIQEWMPFFSGTIRPQGSNETLVVFNGTGGGEISMLRNLLPSVPSVLCEGVYRNMFRRELVHGVQWAANKRELPSLVLV